MCLMWVREHACRQVGQAVLGSLKPRVLLVTTPNREYNPILQHLGNSLIPPKNTRNSDHRFEWCCSLPPFYRDRGQGSTGAQQLLGCGAAPAGGRVLCTVYAVCVSRGCDTSCCCRRARAEFQTWAEETASTHNYAVTFSGIGRALEEHKALHHLSWPAEMTDVGAATQVVRRTLLHVSWFDPV